MQQSSSTDLAAAVRTWLDSSSDLLTPEEIEVAKKLNDHKLARGNSLLDDPQSLAIFIQEITGSDSVIRREDCWPDCVADKHIVVNDVSQLNATKVAGVYQVRTIEDVQKLVKYASDHGLRVTTRGTKHSMGGQSICTDGIIIDMQWVNKMNYCSESKYITTGSGAKWEDLIRYLNRFGKSPRTLQSYASFSVGGTLSVNGHGITTDHSVAESVIRFTLVQVDGSIIVCSPTSEDAKARELFSLCLGGYGLFGIIFDVTMKVNDNTTLFMNTVTIPTSNFRAIYKNVLASNSEMKLARINITTFETIDLFVFSRTSDMPTVSQLGLKPKQMGPITRLIYKWFITPLPEARFAIERALGSALDWSNVSDRNEMLYESADTLARLYSPFVRVDDTFILQEYFIPEPNFDNFMDSLSKLVRERISKETIISLLNITIRFVQRDTITALPYAQHESGVYAFVLYFRIRRNPEADDLLSVYHKLLVKMALEESGSFYLPYRHHFTQEQLLRSYPQWDSFCKRKHAYDPTGLFGNLWWDRYGLPAEHVEKEKVSRHRKVRKHEEHKKYQPDLTFQIPEVSLRRTDSFVKLVNDPVLREQFREGYLVDIFSILSPQFMWSAIVQSVWSSPDTTDETIYASLCAALKQTGGPLSAVTNAWKGVKQISEQKRELVRETMSVLSRLGKIGYIHDYCSIGDHGKLIGPLKKALKMRGQMWIVHDANPDDDSIGAILERGDINGADVGNFVKIHYQSGIKINIPDESCDLVTMNQGLHHLPPENIMPFLAAIRRILRPGGIFITREHDLDEEQWLLPMLDCAHMVFNAGTKEDIVNEKKEIRGFRSTQQWISIIEAAGFENANVYEIQPYDPTVDVMMVFFKESRFAGNGLRVERNDLPALAPPKPAFALPFVSNLPNITLELGVSVIVKLKNALPIIRELFEKVLQLLPDVPGLKEYLSGSLNSSLELAGDMLDRFRPLTEKAKPIIADESDFIPSEVFLLIPALRKKGGFLGKIMINIIDTLFSALTKPDAPPALNVPRQVNNQNTAFSEKEITEEWEKLKEAIPNFNDVTDIIENLGLPARATQLLLTTIPSDTSKAKQWLLENIDDTTWSEVKSALVEVRNNKQAPTIEAILTKDSPWNRVAMAVLGCPSVQITSAQRWYMNFTLALGDLTDLWHEAQNQRKANKKKVTAPLSSTSVQTLNDLYPLQTHDKMHEDIHYVLEIISATYTVKSLSRVLPDVKRDILNEVRGAFNPKTGIVYITNIQLPGSGILIGSRSIHIEYRGLPNITKRSDEFAEQAKKFREQLAMQGLIDDTFRAKNGPLHWYKLPEWLQVEIVQFFGDTLVHTPWYRFPYGQVLKVYFDVFTNIYKTVVDKYKLEGALSSGLVTDLVPLIVMGGLFAQMSALAVPVIQVGGSEYNSSEMIEQVLVAAPESTNWEEFNHILQGQAPRYLSPGVWVVMVPTFKPLTSFIVKLATDYPTASLIEISNQSEVQMKVQIKPGKEQVLEMLKDLADIGVEKLFEFALPTVGAQVNPTQVSLCVPVVSLTRTVRFCQLKGIEIVQVYDFFGS